MQGGRNGRGGVIQAPPQVALSVAAAAGLPIGVVPGGAGGPVASSDKGIAERPYLSAPAINVATRDLRRGDVVFFTSATTPFSVSLVLPPPALVTYQLGVVLTEIPKNAIGLIAISGQNISARVTGPVTVGHYLGIGLQGTFQSMNLDAGWAYRRPTGSVAVALETFTDTLGQIALLPQQERGFSPEVSHYFYEDFESANAVAAGRISASHVWHANVGITAVTPGGLGIWRVAGDGATAPYIALSRDNAGNLALRWASARYPVIKMRWAQTTATAATRYIGLAATALNAVPANGIYFRHSAAGVITAVCRIAGVESALPSLVNAANGVFHTGMLVIESGKCRVLIDGTYIGEIPDATKIPTTDLCVGCGSDAVGAGVGLDVDYLEVEQIRG